MHGVPAAQEIRVPAIIFGVIQRIVPCAVDVVSLPVQRHQIPRVILRLARHHRRGKPRQLCKAGIRLRVALAHGGPVHERVVGVVAGIRLVVTAVRHQIVVQIQINLLVGHGCVELCEDGIAHRVKRPNLLVRIPLVLRGNIYDGAPAVAP